MAVVTVIAFCSLFFIHDVCGHGWYGRLLFCFYFSRGGLQTVLSCCSIMSDHIWYKNAQHKWANVEMYGWWGDTSGWAFHFSTDRIKWTEMVPYFRYLSLVTRNQLCSSKGCVSRVYPGNTDCAARIHPWCDTSPLQSRLVQLLSLEFVMSTTSLCKQEINVGKNVG